MKQKKCTRGAVSAYCPSWLLSSLEELITKDQGKPMRTLVQEMYISITNAARFMVLEDLRYKSYVIRRGQSCWRQARGRRTGSRRTFRRCGTRRSGLPAHLTTAFWMILCRASQSYRSMQSLTTKLRISSRRWRCWWALLTGPSWGRPARGSGPGSMLLLPLTAILMNTLILSMSLCLFLFS